jgi:hypothetical protein
MNASLEIFTEMMIEMAVFWFMTLKDHAVSVFRVKS